MSGTTQTAVSKMFSLPLSPTANDTRKLLFPWGLLVIISFSCFITSFIVILSSFPAGSHNLTSILITGAIPIPLVILFAIGLWRLIKNFKKYKTPLEEERPVWERMIANWSSLYYCSRDAIVFLPGSSRYAEANAMLQTLVISTRDCPD